MNRLLVCGVALTFAMMFGPAWSAEEGDAESKSMQIEKIIAACEEQYKEEDYPDVEERNKLVDQCIDEQSAG